MLDIGVRLFALMALAAFVSLLLAIAGIIGLAASKESLRSIYQDCMVPAEQLAEISQRMLTNRLLLETALSRVRVEADSQGHPVVVWDFAYASRVAQTIETNIATIDSQWQAYLSSSRTTTESALAERYAHSRGAYIHETLRPAIVALRMNRYAVTQKIVVKAVALYEGMEPDLRALTQWQLNVAREVYAKGVTRYENMRLIALVLLGFSVLVMSWLGWILSDSIVNPLKKVIVIFRRISNGNYGTPITVNGRDEISRVMRALGEMQAKLGADEEAIHQLAFYDPLTNLPNRRLLRDRLQQAVSVSARNHQYGAVLMIDLDNFKSINDTQGHDVGDCLLEEVALRIQSCVRKADTVARLGGDEFVVLLVDLGTDEAHAATQAERLGEKILSTLNQPCMLVNKLHHPSGSMGISLYVGNSVSIDDLFKRADMSMYQAKDHGRNTLRFFSPEIQASLEARMTLESELHVALSRSEFVLYYQMQQTNDGNAIGAEILLRWQHPEQGLLLPDQFIPIAEESGLIVPIGAWVLRRACEQLAVWRNYPKTEKLILSVNVSARQFGELDFVQVVETVLMETGASSDRLKLELTESLVMENVDDTIRKMNALNQLGIQFSMDDFGTGYSSLGNLTQLPIQQLKIDRSFVQNIATSRNDAVIAQTIIGMATNLELAVIAEGVETQEQRACLEAFGCVAYQGYLFGRPMPLEEYEALANELLEVCSTAY